MTIFRLTAKILPKKFRTNLSETLDFLNFSQRGEEAIGVVNLSVFLFSLFIGFLLGKIYFISFWYIFIPSVVIIYLLLYFRITLARDKKVRLIEEALPDALQLMASNLKSGMTPDRALLLSARDEFGPLREEIEKVGQKVILGKNIGIALKEMANRVKSKRLIRAIELINSSLQSGGSLSVLLEATATELRDKFLTDNKIKANITMYIIFIFSAVAIISPVLFALSQYLIEVLKTTFAKVDLSAISTTAMPITISQIDISTDFVMMYIVIFMILNSYMTSGILGLINKGKTSEGVKYIVPMMGLALIIFFIASWVVRSTLGGLFLGS